MNEMKRDDVFVWVGAVLLLFFIYLIITTGLLDKFTCGVPAFFWP